MLVEAGPTFLNSLIEAGLWDAAREEVAENIELGEKGRCQAPVLPGYMLKSSSIVDGSRLNFYLRKRNVDFRDL